MSVDLASARTVRWRNPCSAEGMVEARRNIGDVLVAWHLERLTFEAQLLATELVSNAARHAGAANVTVRVIRRPRCVRIEVDDGLRELVPAPEPRPVREGGGIGLHLLANAAPRWGCTVHEHGKTVWFELDR
jgi:anti-sigma regulatory factor (Ser/Thr protein kinase)